MKVSVYRNLRTKSFSIMACEGAHKGKVIAHSMAVHLVNVTYHVKEFGRDAVRREGRKNVHAFVVGDLHNVIGAKSFRGRLESFPMVDPERHSSGPFEPIYYNPYRTDGFMAGTAEGWEPATLVRADQAMFIGGSKQQAMNPVDASGRHPRISREHSEATQARAA